MKHKIMAEKICIISHPKYGRHEGTVTNILLERWPNKKDADVFFWKHRLAFPITLNDLKRDGWDIQFPKQKGVVK